MTEPARALRDRLDRAAAAGPDPVTESVSDDGDTVKFLWQLEGGNQIETVLMLYRDRADGVRLEPGRLRDGVRVLRHRQAGFTRHLTSGEIVEQVVRPPRGRSSSIAG